MAEPDLTELAVILQDTLGRIDNTIIVTAPPAADLGSIGAVAIDLQNNLIYGPKTTSGWGVGRPTVGGPGPAIELRSSATHVEWRVVGASTWINLVALADLKGADGQQIELRTNATHIQWRLGTGTWTDLIALSVLMGADGREIELQRSATHIQWRYVGEVGWADLIPLADITPTPIPGPAAWTAVLAGVVDGERRVQQIVDWVGGGGTKPETGKFIGPTGLVDTAAEATNWRGAGGSGSGDMIAANNLSDLTDDAAARTNLDVYSKDQVDAAVGAIAIPVKTTVAKLQAGTDDTDFATAKALTDALAQVAVTEGAAIAGLDFATFINPTFALTANRTLGAPVNATPGKSGALFVSNNGFTLAWNAAYRLPVGGITLQPVGLTCIPYLVGASGAVLLFPPSKWVAA